MKICFPVESDKGLTSEVFGHFGSAPFFIVFDTKENTTSTINNQDLGHIHGQCNPMKALNNTLVDAVVVGGIGAGAINGLNKKGIKVYKAASETVQGNIQLFDQGVLMEMTLAHTCGGHIGGCAH